MKILKQYWVNILAFLIVIICLLPILETGLYSDDLQVFQSRNASNEYQGKGFTERANMDIAEWISRGRFSPGALYLMEFSFKYFTTVKQYKAFLLGMNLIALISFLSLLVVLGYAQLIPLFLLFYAGGIQLRIHYNDPYTTFSGMYQALTICISLCLIFFILFSKTRSSLWMGGSLILFACTFLISEIGLSVVVLIFIVGKINGQSFKKCIYSIIPFSLISLIYILVVLHLRSNVTQFYSGVKTNFGITEMFNVFFIQLFAALPFSNLFAQYNIGLRLAQQFDSWLNIISIFGISCIFIFILLNSFQKAQRNSSQNQRWLIVFGLALLLVPIAFIMPSSKYQVELYLGVGYLPVYIQNFGMAILLACAAMRCIEIATPFSMKVFRTLSFILLLSIISGFLFNSDLIKLKNYGTSLAPEALYSDIQMGILSDCEEGSIIQLDNNFYWNAASVYTDLSAKSTGKKFNFVLKNDRKPSIDGELPKSCYELTCLRGDTIYTQLLHIDCRSGKNIYLAKCFRNYHNVRLSDAEKHVLEPEK